MIDLVMLKLLGNAERGLEPAAGDADGQGRRWQRGCTLGENTTERQSVLRLCLLNHLVDGIVRENQRYIFPSS